MTHAMNFKVLLRSVVFLLMLFVVLYAGINNTHPIDFSFPLASPKDIHQPAAYIFFGMFAVGVLGGRCSPQAAAAGGAVARTSRP